MKKRNRKIKIILLLVIGVIIFRGVIFFVGMKIGENKKPKQNSDTPADNSKTKKDLEDKLKQLKEQLNKENDSKKKKKLEEEKEDLEQQIKNLGGGSNNDDPNNPKNPPSQNPPKISRKITVKYNTEVGGKHEYININDNKERILIDTKNKVFSTGGINLSQKGQYTIYFNEEDATEKKGNNFIFDENNDKFELRVPINIPNNNNPANSDQVEMEISIASPEKEYIRFHNNLNPGDWDSGKVKPVFIFISKKNLVWGGKNWDEIDWKKVPNFKISFLKKDVSKYEVENTGWGEKGEYYFYKNNQEFTLTPLGNWPDEPNQSPPLPGNNNPPPTKKKITLQLRYFFKENTEKYCFMEGEVENGIFIKKKNPKIIFISQTNPAVNKILKKYSEYKISFELDSLLERLFEDTGVLSLEKDDAIEVAEM